MTNAFRRFLHPVASGNGASAVCWESKHTADIVSVSSPQVIAIDRREALRVFRSSAGDIYRVYDRVHNTHTRVYTSYIYVSGWRERERGREHHTYSGPQFSMPRANIYTVAINQFGCLWQNNLVHLDRVIARKIVPYINSSSQYLNLASRMYVRKRAVRFRSSACNDIAREKN